MVVAQTIAFSVGDREEIGSRDPEASPEWQGFGWVHENHFLPKSPKNILTRLRVCYSKHLPSKMCVAHFGAEGGLPQISVELLHLSDQDKKSSLMAFIVAASS